MSRKEGASSLLEKQIALVVPGVYRSGGLERFGCELANWLAEKGAMVSLWSQQNPSGKTLPITPLDPTVNLCFYEIDQPNSARQLLHQLKTELLIVLGSGSESSYWLQLLANSPIPLLYSEHTNPSIIENQWWSRSERRAFLAAADAVHLLLESYRVSVPQEYREKIAVLPNFSRFPLKKTDRSNRSHHLLLSLGRLDREAKQLHLLINAFSELSADFPHWKLELWGEGADKPRLQRLIEEKKASHCISFKGEAGNAAEQYQRADLFCIPSRYEGFPNTVVEAMAHGLPVVGFADCSGVNSIIQHQRSGLLAAEMSVDSLKAELTKLMQNREERERLSEGAYLRAADFDRKTVLSQWEGLILQTLQYYNQTSLQHHLKEKIDDDPLLDHFLLWEATTPYHQRPFSQLEPLLSYIDRYRNKKRILLPWGAVYRFWRLRLWIKSLFK